MQTTTGNTFSIIVIADHLAFFSIDRHNVAYDTRYQPKVNASRAAEGGCVPAFLLPRHLHLPFAERRTSSRRTFPYHTKGMTLYFTRVLYSR